VLELSGGVGSLPQAPRWNADRRARPSLPLPVRGGGREIRRAAASQRRLLSLGSRMSAAAKVYDRPMNAALFEEWVEKCLLPTLSKGDIVVIDNLSAHKGARVEQLIKSAGAELRYLPPYSPDMNPIEKAFSKLKAYLRKIAFPVFATGVVPSTSVHHYRFAGSQIPVVCNGVSVNAGDIVVADSDGVAVVPKGQAQAVLTLAQQMDYKEHSMYALIEQFKSIVQAVKKVGRL